MDAAAAALPAFVALLLLSPWPLLGSAQGQFSAGDGRRGAGNFPRCAPLFPAQARPGRRRAGRCGTWLFFIDKAKTFDFIFK
ncbi:hypothetical protein FD755_007045 [Muntiacus reevesi]|uniref:Uncharacterized protein n=2 Tax=Muntiacus TaxID=9885 RepID=A0A5J5MII9_MUNRE|nr:hypothetical protein FD754_008430 [Muntiacus muntjak]KAB0379261.1 hypothetical protein FD755_007045 [Muntiacus reevesi]